jgi:hypothetical protein
VNLLLWIAAFALTFCENAVGLKYNKESISGSDVSVSNWGTIHDALLLIDGYLVAAVSPWLALPILVGSWLGTYCSSKYFRKQASLTPTTKEINGT